MLSARKLSRWIITVAFAVSFVLGTNILAAEAAVEQTTPNNDKLVQSVTDRPTVVSGLTVAPESKDKLILQWDEVSGASSYKIYRSTKPVEDFKRVGISTTTSFVDNDVKANHVYYYQVSAVNETGEGSRSSSAYGATKLPGKVTNISVAVISASQLDLSWKAVKGATSYELYRSSSLSAGYIHIATSTTNSYSDKDLTPDCTYYYKISAVNGIGEGKSAKAFLGETKVPGQVAHLKIKALGESQLYLSWDAVSGADSYKIYRAGSSSGNYTLVGTSSITDYQDKGLREKTTYYYKVTAVNVIGEGTAKKAISKKTKS